MQDAIDWGERYATQAELDGIDDRLPLKCDQCGYIPTSDWNGFAGSQCPRHWDPDSGCDGILRDDPEIKP